MRIIAIRGGGLGDIILTIPSFLALKKFSREFYLSVPSQWNSLFEGFSDVIPLEGRLISSIWKGGEEFLDFLGRFDIAVTWHWDKEGVFVKNLSKVARKVIAGKIKPERIHYSLTLFSSLYEVDRKIKFPEMVRLPNLSYWEPEKKSEIIIHPGSGSIKKVWPIKNFLFLIERLLSENRKVKVILGESEDRKEFSVFSNLKGVDVRRGLTLKEVINELLKGVIYIGNDSGISHLSALLGIPTIVIFKETDPEVWAPKGERVYLISTYPNKEWPDRDRVLNFVKMILSFSSRGFKEATPGEEKKGLV